MKHTSRRCSSSGVHYVPEHSPLQPSLQLSGGGFFKAEGRHRALYPEPNAFLNTKCYTWQLFMAATFYAFAGII